jgi:hypothetical protein
LTAYDQSRVCCLTALTRHSIGLFARNCDVPTWVSSPSISRRRGMSRQNKAKRNMRVQEVGIQSVIRPYKADNILNFKIRYQATSAISVPGHGILRSFLLNTLFLNQNSGTVNYRLCAAVRVNKVEITTSIAASLEWQSENGPTSATVITGTSTTAPGYLSQRPPKDSLCQFWATSGTNESVSMFQISCTVNDYVDVSFSIVLLDRESGVVVTTAGSGQGGQVYRSSLDGPATGAVLVPVYFLTLN